MREEEMRRRRCVGSESKNPTIRMWRKKEADWPTKGGHQKGFNNKTARRDVFHQKYKRIIEQ